ncbi:MAG: Flp pilus assembly protein CpaB [Actinomycetia bacterium]|nr:Flp pilus assembly protein CpaB [Actinomycetes bacterium]MCP5030548.1 Flp pilus assembly protein CpaB [Actinomycetes bacterium]
MTRRIAGSVAAILLAFIGTVTLVAYVASAERRALAGEELVEVYVITTPIASGTAAEEVEDRVTVEHVPVKVRASGAVDNLATLVGLVAAVDLMPGEQLLTGRFVPHSELANREIGIDVPEDMVEVTIELDGQRAVGGLLEAGQTVAIFASFDPFEASTTVVDVNGEAVPFPSAVADEIGGEVSSTTDLLFHKVLVTAVQDRTGRASAAAQQQFTTAPDSTLFITFAVPSFDAERLIFTAEFGSIWLAIERETAPDNDEPGQSRGSVLLDLVGRR